MATDTIARGMAEGVVSQVSADRQAVSEDRDAVEAAKTEVLNVAESIPEDYSTLSADVSELKEDLVKANTTINITSITNGKFIKNDGTVQSDENSSITDYIPVYPNNNIIVSNYYLYGARSICAYDADKQYVTTLRTDRPLTEIESKISIPSNCYFIRITSAKGVIPTAIYASVIPEIMIKTYEDTKKLSENTDDLISGLNELELTYIDGITMRDGFVHIMGGYIDTSSSYSATNFINVIPKSTVLIKNSVLSGNAGICGYSITKEFITNLTGTLGENGRHIEIPEHVYYIRVTAKNGDIVSVKYVNNHKLNDRIKDFVFNLPTDISYTKNENQVMAKDGILVDKTGYGHTNYIEVFGGKTVVVKGVTGYEYCGVILFDKSKRIIKYIETPSRFGFVEETEISLPFNCAYIVANIVLPNTNLSNSHFYVYYKEGLNLIDEKLNEHKGELLNDIQVNTDEFIQGYYYGKQQNYVKDDRFAVSPKIYVCDDTDVIFHQYAHVNATSVTFYDATGKLLERREGGSGSHIYNETVHIPLGTAYMIYTVFVDQLSEHYITYAEPYKSDYQINKYVSDWIKKSKLNISSIFNKCNRPILTLIDDDTVSVEAVRAFKNACDNLGVKGTYATVARTLENSEELTNELLSYEKEGFHIAFHAYNQSAVSGNDGYVSFQDAVEGIRFFNSKGFLDFMYWVYPYGIPHQEEARKLGFKCGVLADNDSLETCQDGRFNLKRVEIYTDGNYPTASEIKAMIDEAVATGSWLITETHFSYSDNPVEKFNEIVQYALDSGMEVMTLNDAFRLKEPIYRLYDMF